MLQNNSTPIHFNVQVCTIGGPDCCAASATGCKLSKIEDFTCTDNSGCPPNYDCYQTKCRKLVNWWLWGTCVAFSIGTVVFAYASANYYYAQSKKLLAGGEEQV